MFSLCDLRFLLCSRDLDVLRVQRIIVFFLNLNYPQINEVEKSTGLQNKMDSRVSNHAPFQMSFDKIKFLFCPWLLTSLVYI